MMGSQMSGQERLPTDDVVSKHRVAFPPMQLSTSDDGYPFIADGQTSSHFICSGRCRSSSPSPLNLVVSLHMQMRSKS
jgi:hypothetical protein